MNKYKLYFTFSIIIISPAPDRQTVPLHVVPNLPRHVHHQLEIFFLRSAFLETADQTSQRDYQLTMIGTRSIGAPLIKTYPKMTL